MSVNPFFNLFNNTNEQNLYDELTVESIRQGGHNVVYLPRTLKYPDQLLNEAESIEFNHAIDIEVQIININNFEGDGSFLSKFGLEIRDSMTLIMAKRSFEQFIVPQIQTKRPYEGDCIYIPMLKQTYQVKYVNSTPIFYTLGKLNVWELSLDLLEFSNEKFNTGRKEIDDLNPEFGHADDPDYDLESYDTTAQNKIVQNESDNILDFDEMNPFILGEE